MFSESYGRNIRSVLGNDMMNQKATELCSRTRPTKQEYWDLNDRNDVIACADFRLSMIGLKYETHMGGT